MPPTTPAAMATPAPATLARDRGQAAGQQGVRTPVLVFVFFLSSNPPPPCRRRGPFLDPKGRGPAGYEPGDTDGYRPGCGDGSTGRVPAADAKPAATKAACAQSRTRRRRQRRCDPFAERGREGRPTAPSRAADDPRSNGYAGIDHPGTGSGAGGGTAGTRSRPRRRPKRRRDPLSPSAGVMAVRAAQAAAAADATNAAVAARPSLAERGRKRRSGPATLSR